MVTPSFAAFSASASARSSDFGDSRSSATSGGTPNASISSRLASNMQSGVLKCLISALADLNPKPRTRNNLNADFITLSLWERVG